MTKKESDKLSQIYELYEQPMYRIAFAVLRNEAHAEDAVSDAFLHIIPKLGRLGDANSPKTKSYVVKVIKSSAIDIYRKNRRFYANSQPIDEEVQVIPDIMTDVENDVLEGEIPEILDMLNDTDKRIFMLRTVDELPWCDVAERMKMTEANVRKRFARARKKLAENGQR